MPWERSDSSRALPSLSADALLRLLFESESEGASVPIGEVARIARLVEEAAARIEHGGRLWLAAAGSLGHLVRFAGDESRFWFSGVLPIEVLVAERDGAEEDAVTAVEDSVHPEDVVLGVSRSGASPWTCMVLRKSNMVGALTASISCVKDSPVARESDMPIVVVAGAELVYGCTQYRAGTIVKTVIDAVLLALAARRGGLWGDVPVRAQVGADGWRLVAAAGEVDPLRARSLLAAASGDVLVAIVMARLSVDAEEARQRLERAGWRLEDVLGER